MNYPALAVRVYDLNHCKRVEGELNFVKINFMWVRRALFFSSIAIFLLYGGCKKDEDIIPETINPEALLTFSIDTGTLYFDNLSYFNSAGNNYSVTNLQFYLSSFEFENANGNLHQFDDVIYVDGKLNPGQVISFPKLPAGNYKRMKFLIGLDSLHNKENALPNTIENNNMVWPVPMGGGYHFLKLEGNFIDSGQTYGFAMHLGRTENSVPVNLVKNFSISSSTPRFNLQMNINEWFKNPHIYNFNTDGNYSMGDSAAMTKLKQNGSDVFSIIEIIK